MISKCFKIQKVKIFLATKTGLLKRVKINDSFLRHPSVEDEHFSSPSSHFADRLINGGTKQEK